MELKKQQQSEHASEPRCGDTCNLVSYGTAPTVAFGIINAVKDGWATVNVSTQDIQNEMALLPLRPGDTARVSFKALVKGKPDNIFFKIEWCMDALHVTTTREQLAKEFLEDSMDLDLASAIDSTTGGIAPAGSPDLDSILEDRAGEDEAAEPTIGEARPAMDEDTPLEELEALKRAFWYGDRDYKRQTVLLDALHAMKRVTDTLGHYNSLKPIFCSRLRDVIFCINDEDIATVWADLRERKWTDKEIEAKYRHNYSYFVGKSRRSIDGPKELAAKFDRLIQIFEPTAEEPGRGWCTDSGTYLIFKKRTLDAISNLRGHILNGCLSDPEDFNMYYNIGKVTSGRSDYRTFRGTSQLEGYHHHLRQVP